MSKIRIQNKSKGERGVYVGGVLEFVASGKTRVFSNATAEEISLLSSNTDLRVQTGEDGNWEDVSEIELPDARQWLVIATDGDGTNMRRIPLGEHEWFIGTAVASEEPETAPGYTFEKIGGSPEVVTEEAAVASGEFDADAYLDQNAATVIPSFEGKDAATLELLLAAEKEGKKRKGVIAALEEMLTEPNE